MSPFNVWLRFHSLKQTSGGHCAPCIGRFNLWMCEVGWVIVLWDEILAAGRVSPLWSCEFNSNSGTAVVLAAVVLPSPCICFISGVINNLQPAVATMFWSSACCCVLGLMSPTGLLWQAPLSHCSPQHCWEPSSTIYLYSVRFEEVNLPNMVTSSAETFIG